MSAQHRRAARAEARLAESLKTTRTKYRPRYQRAPDVAPIRLPDGTVIQGESKHRRTLPKWIVDAVTQAESYAPGAVGLVALYQRGSAEGLAVMRLRDLLVLLGLEPRPAGDQLTLAPRCA